MDKFVVRTPRDEIQDNPVIEVDVNKQATLESLRGVVVIEDILRYKNSFEMPDADNETIFANLSELLNKQPSKEVLISTGIGKSVHKLCKNQDKKISLLAKKIYHEWKQYIINKCTQPPIEVKYDLKTESLRTTARKWLAKSLKEDDDNTVDRFSVKIEKVIFEKCKKITNKSYNKTIRKTMFALKSEDLRKKLISEEISIEELVNKYWK